MTHSSCIFTSQEVYSVIWFWALLFRSTQKEKRKVIYIKYIPQV